MVVATGVAFCHEHVCSCLMCSFVRAHNIMVGETDNAHQVGWINEKQILL